MSVVRDEIMATTGTHMTRGSAQSHGDIQQGLTTSFLDVNPKYWPALRTISRLAQLQENWDTYGSPPIQQIAVEGAFLVMMLIEAESLRPPLVVPVPGGGIQFEWNTTPRQLELEVGSDGSVVYLRTEDSGREEEGALPTYRDSRLTALLRWLLYGNDDSR